MMPSLYIIQLIGVVLTLAGFIALGAAAHIFGAPISPADKRRASDEWNRNRNAYRLPINLEVIASTLFFVGGIGILAWSRFDVCIFLAYWLPPLPDILQILLSCRAG